MFQGIRGLRHELRPHKMHKRAHRTKNYTPIQATILSAVNNNNNNNNNNNDDGVCLILLGGFDLDSTQIRHDGRKAAASKAATHSGHGGVRF